MITTYRFDDGRLQAGGGDAPVWFDLVEPTADEIAGLERELGLALPTLDDMDEIEISSRLYVEDEALFMTAMITARAEGDSPEVKPVTFILARERLVTIRYHAPQSFDVYTRRAARAAPDAADGEGVLLDLLDVIVDRQADLLESAGRAIDEISRRVFSRRGPGRAGAPDYRATLGQIGRQGELTSNLRDGLLTLQRLVSFMDQHENEQGTDRRALVKNLARDIASLLDHAGFLSQKITFLLDATLGLINIEQNGIIKIFSVAAVIFLPPTLVASIYGMNFDVMPELAWRFGYPMALGLMMVSALLPYLFFRHKGWL